MRAALLGSLVTVALQFGSLGAQDSPAIAPHASAKAAQLLTVQLTSGRIFTGLVDPRTNDERLVLRFERDGATLRRPIQWDRIVRALAGEQEIELARLREVAEAMKSEVEGREPGIGNREGEAPAEPSVVAPHVSSIAIDPRLANWDGDVETDGLLIDVMPLDAEGYLVAASGLVEVELFAQQRRVFHHAPRSRGETLERVERWTASVEAEGFGPSGIRLKLPFGAVHPEFDLDWNAVGLVHVKFTAPGHGIFEDSRDAVRIRPFAPLRDELQMSTGRRFVPTEGVGRRD
jgi:hypothetical protein